MHASLELLFAHLKGGLLWLAADGRVKFANAEATRLSGLKGGGTLHECTLRKAVQVIAAGKRLEPIEMEFVPQGAVDRVLHATAAPALVAGDVFVLLEAPALHGEALALDNLMTVIRSDLATPLDRLTRSLDLMRDGAINAVAAQETLEQTRGLVDTLNRMVDLSQIWSSESLLANDRLQVWALLQQAWQQAQPFAQSKRLTVRLVSLIPEAEMPVTYGSEFWIRRVVTESLQAALRAAGSGATLDIELRQMGPRVLIVFRNSGMWPAAARNAVTLHDGQARPAGRTGIHTRPVHAKDLIGLHLCERIIRLHGGLLREEVDDAGLRNFLIDLPTGAPGREGADLAMDAAQAQRYAADLAALMARRRRAPPAAG